MNWHRAGIISLYQRLHVVLQKVLRRRLELHQLGRRLLRIAFDEILYTIDPSSQQYRTTFLRAVESVFYEAPRVYLTATMPLVWKTKLRCDLIIPQLAVVRRPSISFAVEWCPEVGIEDPDRAVGLIQAGFEKLQGNQRMIVYCSWVKGRRNSLHFLSKRGSMSWISPRPVLSPQRRLRIAARQRGCRILARPISEAWKPLRQHQHNAMNETEANFERIQDISKAHVRRAENGNRMDEASRRRCSRVCYARSIGRDV